MVEDFPDRAIFYALLLCTALYHWAWFLAPFRPPWHDDRSVPDGVPRSDCDYYY